MKTKTPSVLILTILCFALPASGQNPNNPRSVSPPVQIQPAPQPRPVVAQPGQPQNQMQPGQPQIQNTAEFPHNVKLTLQGSLFGTIPTDFSIITGGRTVSSDMMLGSKDPAPIIGSFQAVVTPGDPWQVAISIGARVPMQVGNNNIEYRDCRLSTTVRIVPGKKVVLWEKGDQKLTLLMEKVED